MHRFQVLEYLLGFHNELGYVPGPVIPFWIQIVCDEMGDFASDFQWNSFLDFQNSFESDRSDWYFQKFAPRNSCSPWKPDGRTWFLLLAVSYWTSSGDALFALKSDLGPIHSQEDGVQRLASPIVIWGRDEISIVQSRRKWSPSSEFII